MPERIAKVAQQYAGRDIAVGERFDVEPENVGLLMALGRIEPEGIAVKPAEPLNTMKRGRGRPRKIV